MKFYFISLCVSLCCFSAQAQGLIDSLLQQAPNESVLHAVLNRNQGKDLQVCYTQISCDAAGKPSFQTFSHNTETYYYPASMVKLPLAALALEKLRSLPNLDLNTPMLGLSEGRRVYIGCMAEAIEQMLVLSNNETYNLLFEWLGPDHIHRRLREMGYDSVYVLHNFASNPDSRFRRIFFSYHGEVLHQENTPLPRQPNTGVPFENAAVGQFHLEGRRWLPGPKDYKTYNYFSLNQAHHMLISLIYPEAFPEKQRFKLSKEDYDFLRYYMGCFPREADRKGCDSTEYHDTYMKFFMNAQDKNPRNGTLRCYNKTGLAAGFMSECAYFVDTENGLAFFLSAALFTNPLGRAEGRDEDYEQIAYPAFSQVFDIIYRHEKSKNTRHACLSLPQLPKASKSKD